MTLLEIFEEQFESLGRTPTGAKVSYDLWRELSSASKIVYAPAQMNFRGQTMPIGQVPTYRGTTFLQLDPELGDQVDFVFSPA